MAGLLSDYESGAFLKGLLGSAQRGKPFTALLGGLANMQIATDAQAEREKERAIMERKLAMEEEFKRAQVAEFLAQAQARQQQAAAEQAKMQRAAQFSEALGSAGVMTPTRAASLPGGPTPDNADRIGASTPIDWQSLAVRFPEMSDTLAKVAGARNLGRDKVARTVKGVGPDGREYEYQVDEYGKPVGEALPQWKAPIQANRGGSIDFLDPYKLSPMQSLPTTQTPDSKASNAVAWANHNLSKERLAVDKAQGDIGAPFKVPLGYMLAPDGRSVVAIPGGPADIKAGELGAKLSREKDAATSGAQNVLDTIKEAKGLTGWKTAGLGGVTAAVPMTDARELAGKLQTIKANLGFDRLQEMRRNSPTGGALGQVAVQELNALQATVASLDQLQDPRALGRALDKAEKHYTRWLEVVSGSTGGATGDFGSTSKVRKFNPETGRIE